MKNVPGLNATLPRLAPRGATLTPAEPAKPVKPGDVDKLVRMLAAAETANAALRAEVARLTGLLAGLGGKPESDGDASDAEP